MRAAPQDNAKSTTNNWGSYYADTGTVYYPISSGTQVLASLPVPRLLACRRILAG